MRVKCKRTVWTESRECRGDSVLILLLPCQVAFGKLLLFPVTHFTVRNPHFTFTFHKWEVRAALWLLRSISIFPCLKPYCN